MAVEGANDMVLQPDNNIIVVGGGCTTSDCSAGNDTFVAKFTADSSFDTAFGSGGIAINNFSTGNDSANSAIIQSQDNKIIVGGNQNSSWVLHRFNTNGVLDSTFGTNGTFAPNVGQAGSISDIALQSDNKLLAIGSVSNGSYNDWALVRFLGISNHAPILDPIGNKTISEGQLLRFTITASDPDNDTLTYSAANLPSGAAFDHSTHTFSWTPGFDQEGNYENIEFTVTDDGNPIELDTELITITVGNVNRPPIFDPIGSKEVLENELLTFIVNATDPDGNGITLSSTNLPIGASFDTQSGLFSWTPTLNQSGNYVVTFNATDNGTPNQTGTIDVAITVGDNPTPTEQAQNLVSAVLSYNFPANVENSYLANLKKVEKFIEEGKMQPAINQLNAFSAKVEKDYTAGIITRAIRDNLVSLTQALLADLR